MLKSNESSEEIMMKDTEVEVCSEEEGFEGAWFRAILEENTTTKKSKFRVHYLTLLSEDGSSPLVEYIEHKFIRPVPLEKDYEGIDIEEGVFVDAYHRDGYWTGFVVKMLKDDNFLVSFDYPLDILQFKRQQLRPHLHWSGFKWRRPRKVEMRKTKFSPGTNVEVRYVINKKEIVWVPSMIIKEEVDDKKELVVKKCNKHLSCNGDEARRVTTVQFRHVRPIPPSFRSVDAYSLMETVEAFHGLGWRRGLVMKILYNKSYTVSFVDANKEYVLQHSDLRPFKVWEDEVWRDGPKHIPVTETPSISIVKKKQVRSSLGANQMDSKEATKREKRSLSPEEISKTLAKAKTVSVTTSVARTPQVTSIANESVSLVTPSPVITTTSGTQEKTSGEETFQLMRNQNGLGADSTKEKVKGSSLAQETGNQMTGDATLVIIPQVIPKETVPPVIPVINETLVKEPEAKTQGNASPGKTLHSDLGIDSTGNTMSEEKKMQEYTRKRKKEHKHDSKLSDAGKACNASNDMITGLCDDDEDKPLSAWTVGGNSSTSSDKSIYQRKLFSSLVSAMIDQELSSDQCGTASKNTAVDETRANEDTTMVLPFAKHSPSLAQGSVNEIVDDVKIEHSGTSDITATPTKQTGDKAQGNTSRENETDLGNDSTRENENNRKRKRDQNLSIVANADEEIKAETTVSLPFEKKLSIWKKVESMEAFKTTPQTPHFSPLVDTEEDSRETSAVSMMYLYSELIEEAKSLKFSSPVSELKGLKDSLTVLEKNGFDVKALQSRIQKLMSLKDKQAKKMKELKVAEKGIAEKETEKVELLKLHDEADKEIAQMKSSVEMIEQELDVVELEFHTTVSAS